MLAIELVEFADERLKIVGSQFIDQLPLALPDDSNSENHFMSMISIFFLLNCIYPNCSILEELDLGISSVIETDLMSERTSLKIWQQTFAMGSKHCYEIPMPRFNAVGHWSSVIASSFAITSFETVSFATISSSETISSFVIVLLFEIPSLGFDSFSSVILSLEKVTILTFSWNLRCSKDYCQILMMYLTRL